MAKKRCDWRFFFSFLQKKKKGQYFHGKKKVEKILKIAVARLASILATRCTGNRIFLWTALLKSTGEASQYKGVWSLGCRQGGPVG